MTEPIPLRTQEEFEAMYFLSKDHPPLSSPVLIWFSAKWCGPCKRVNYKELQAAFPNLKIFKCDVDENNYTPGFVGVRSIPSFIILYGPKTLSSPFQSSDTKAIIEWVRAMLDKKA
jgi:thioredoxin-like negative regulator of GroEL